MIPTKKELTAVGVTQAIYLSSPYLLGKHLLGYKDFCETQIEWSDKLVTTFTPEKPKKTKLLVLQPRETFKSSFWTVTETIWLLLRNPNLTILIASETITNADAFVAEIRAKMESDPFVKVFGKLLHPDFTGSSTINMINRTSWSKECNVETAGLGKAITGKHYDVVLCNDLVGMADRDSAAKRQVTYNFFVDLQDILKKEAGFLQLEGTRWHREDLYAHIIDKIAPELLEKGLGEFIIYVKPAHDPETGKLNFPRLLSEKKLQELKTVKQGRDGIDVSTFQAQYELNPMAPGEQIFKTFTFINPNNYKYEKFVQWTDPALSKKETSCYSVTAVIAQTGQFWDVVYCSIKRRSPSDIVNDHNRIYRMHRDLYKIRGNAYMEDNGFQLLLRDNCIKQSAQEKDPIPTVGRVNTENKLARIRTMEPFVSQGFIRFREDWRTAPEGYALLLEQLQNFPQGKIDAPDALQCAHHEAHNTISFRSL